MDSILKQLQDLHDNELGTVGNPLRESPSLYHYTSLQSSLEIIQKNTLRFTNILYLNDPIELTHGLEIAEKVMVPLIKEYSSKGNLRWTDMLYTALIQVLGSIAPSKKTNDVAAALKPYISKYLHEFHTEVSNNSKWSIYVFCLSKKSDDLRQWLAYGDNTSGVALEFNPYHDITERPDIFRLPVSYAKHKCKENFLSNFLRDAGEIYINNFTKIIENKNNIKFFTKLVNILLFDLVACKNPQYSDEEEWRLFFLHEQPAPETASDAFPQQQPSFYVKGGLLRPYHDFELKKDAITGITLGAHCQNDLNIDAFKMLCANHGMPNLKITPSEVQYRG
jgi:hypothetical protein